MGAYIPEQVAESALSRKLLAAGLARVHQGKVRDAWSIPGHDRLLLQVATDRVSVFDFVLPCLMKGKGEVLTALTVFWLEEVLVKVDDHLLSWGGWINDYLPRSLQDDLELQRRALIVDRLEMLPVECIVRGYLTGSAWKDYQKTGEICGHKLPAGLHDGSRLPTPLFTPTTKAVSGHDVPIPIDEARERWPFLEAKSLEVYRRLRSIALEEGIILADTKFEFGLAKGDVVLADEVATPDSSRYWRQQDWEQALINKQAPHGYDKQLMRNWAQAQGIHVLDPLDLSNAKTIAQLQVPQTLIELTVECYREIFTMLTSRSLQNFQEVEMDI